MMKYKVLWVVIMVCCLGVFAVASVHAQEDAPPTITVDEGDSPLRVVGQLGVSGNFAGNVRLTSNTDVTFTFLPSDLHMVDGDEVVGREHLFLVGERRLLANTPTDFQLTVTGLEVAGEYESTIEIYIVGQARSESLKIPVQVSVSAQPTLIPQSGTDILQLRLVNCSWGINCMLAHWVLPASARLDSWDLYFENPTGSAAIIEATNIVAHGVQTGFQLTEEQVILPLGRSFPANQISSIPLTITRSTMPPDHYTGSLFMSVKGSDERITIPLDISVRSGPFYPLLALLAGIILGRLFKYMQERGVPLTEALSAVTDVEIQLSRAHPVDQAILQGMIKEVRQLVYREKLAQSRVELAKIEKRLNILKVLRRIEHSIEDNEVVGDNERTILLLIEQARDFIERQEDERAQVLIDQIRDKLDASSFLDTGGSGGGEGFLLETMRLSPDRTSSLSRMAIPEAAVPLDPESEPESLATNPRPPATNLPNWIVMMQDWWDQLRVYFYGEWQKVRAEATFGIVGPLLYLALMIALLVVGLNTYYIVNGVYFGANPVGDYLGLVLWGMSADVASRNLSNFRGIPNV